MSVGLGHKSRYVVDTNVIVSALLKPGSVPDRALRMIWETSTLLYDERVIAEYRAVLTRPKFQIDADRVAMMLEAILGLGTLVTDVSTWDGRMRDADDRIFIEVALAGSADAIVTGT